MVNSVGRGSTVDSALQGLQRTSQQINQTNERLGTRFKAKGLLEKETNFSNASGLSAEANKLAQVKDQVDQAISTIQAAAAGLDFINQLSDQARAITITAENNSDPAERAHLADQFNQVRSQIDTIASDASFSGTNLIGASPDSMEVALGEDGSLLTVQGTDSSSAGLGINSRTFGSNTDIQSALADIESAQSQIRSSLVTLSSSTSTLQNRITFTDNLTNTLAQGVASLSQTDLNEEAASLLSLQTRQALGSNALTIATANEQAVLGLFD
tara:strand:+ start:2288 stop:3100 length:813 start_codon:yes stop_codon:yes gene_type:complete